jgi:hypothetical protein
MISMTYQHFVFDFSYFIRFAEEEEEEEEDCISMLNIRMSRTPARVPQYLGFLRPG